ncbi:MAG: PQQ-dependent sugar dehydrogenase [Hyphomicrobiaceae bacterium]
MPERTGSGSRMCAAIAALAGLTAAGDAVAQTAAGAHGSAYQASGRCGPFPRAPLKTPPWLCVGIVAGPAHGLVMPRLIVEVGKNHFIVVDMGAWSPGRGRVLALHLDRDSKAHIKTLFDRLDVPHGLALGPDKRVYVGERSEIWRFDPADPLGTRQSVRRGLPSAGLHRLKHFVFDTQGNIVVNLGAPTDRCEGQSASVQWPCPTVEGDKPEAALWKLHLTWPEGRPGAFEPLARGLRNSVALAVHPGSGLLVQAENSVDLRTEEYPPEELNIIRPGGHYGWPYCLGNNELAQDYKGKGIVCSRYERPEVLVPAHAAPLGMTYYTGALFPELKGKLLIAFHGYRRNGHRLAAYDTTKEGRPLAPAPRAGGLPGFPAEIVGGWQQMAGVRPRGAPVGLTMAADGAIWFAEDKNRTVMVLLRAAHAAADVPQPPPKPRPRTSPPAVPEWAAFYGEVLTPHCSRCHEDFQTSDAKLAWRRLFEKDWLTAPLSSSSLFQSMLGEGGRRPMPPPDGATGDPGLLNRVRSFLRNRN